MWWKMKEARDIPPAENMAFLNKASFNPKMLSGEGSQARAQQLKTALTQACPWKSPAWHTACPGIPHGPLGHTSVMKEQFLPHAQPD